MGFGLIKLKSLSTAKKQLFRTYRVIGLRFC
jgi:hypothetical protein